ncbi:MucBP domain-containing protein [Levilactobacillus tujiorum]|uniref:MucBP domain-containing protein n=1 Tax=Levilactobacillus tujiorum TaxID=2912243 RepID=A0ABX1L563_9LACO|nr:MucBP domain-containing protein [Levilactobacillus tujiorum]MCH5465504.1 hypothetical protein [Levilactobacillus tujiorum]NLR12590.1 hypothetical protein [Lactobacillus sp. HBUAS51387]NLR29793.1 hypothetical protein [Levilactobacillus tujiorum]
MRKTSWLSLIGVVAGLGLGWDLVVQGQAVSKQGKVIVYYRYNESNKHPKRMTNYSVKTLHGRIGQHYTTKAKDLLTTKGWILRYHSANVSGNFKAKTTKVYYDYQIDSLKDYEHTNGASTYIDRTADHRLIFLGQTHLNGAGTALMRLHYHTPVYKVTYSSPNEHQSTHNYRFGKTYVYRDHEKDVYTLTLSKKGDVTLQQEWATKKGKHHVETTKVSATGKYLSYHVR